MTNPPPPDPRSSKLGFDELIAIVVAFTVIGTILFWTISRRDTGWNLTGVPDAATPDQQRTNIPTTPSPRATPEDSVTPLPSAEVTPRPREAFTPPSPVVVPEAGTRPVYVPVPADPPISSAELDTPPATTPPTPAAPASVAPVPTTPTPAESLKFSDVPQDYWARPYIEAMAQREIVAGFTDGTFRPGQPITRAEFAVMLHKAFGQNTTQNGISYKDVSGDFWAASEIKQSSTLGFLRGYPGQIFRPTQQIPRTQVFVSLANGLKLTPPADAPQVLQTYQDAAQIPQYATNAVAAATTEGLVVNHPDPKELRPQQAATRAEVAAAIYQALVQAGKAEKISSNPPVQPK